MQTSSGESFTNLISRALQSGELDKADELFHLVASPLLYPEMDGLQPDSESYDIMIQACAKAGELASAEKYLNEMAVKGFQPKLKSCTMLLWACINNDEARRGHNRCETLVRDGCAERVACSPEDLRVGLMDQSFERLDVGELMEAILALSRALADKGNARSANRWLHYLTECGMRPEDSAKTWNHVRAAHPPIIVDSVLSCDSPRRTFPGTPKASFTQPHKLSGEDGTRDKTFGETSTSIHSQIVTPASTRFCLP